MKSLNRLNFNMQTKVKKQLEISRLKENFTKLGTHDIKCYEQYVGIRSRHLKIIPELHPKSRSAKQLYLKVTFLDSVAQQIAPSALVIVANENRNV